VPLKLAIWSGNLIIVQALFFDGGKSRLKRKEALHRSASFFLENFD
jgi:hypothetical protein